MSTDRRQFIKTADVGIVGWGIGFDGVAGAFRQAGDVGGYFPRASPESQGVSSEAIRQFIAAANASGFSWHSFMLIRHGHVIAEGWWKPFEPQYVHSLYSLSKSFTSTAIGLLVKEGKLDIHAKVASFFPQDLLVNPSDNFQQMTVKHLLTMNTGHGSDTLPAMRNSHDSTWVHTYLAQPVEFAPGTHFLYNTGNTYMLGAILHQVTGQTLEQYLAPRLFQPLGITGYDWEVSPQGLNTAGYGLRVKTEDIAKLAQLYLQKGEWKGKSILTESWVGEATSTQTTSQVNNGDWSEGYGYQFWRCTHGFYRGDGAFGQYCIVMPQLDAVLAVTEQTPDMQKSMNIIWDHLPAGMQAGVLPANSAGEAALKKDLADLVLPVVKGAMTSPLSANVDKRAFKLERNDLGVESLSFAFSGKACKLSVTGGVKAANAALADKPTVLEFGWENWIVNKPRTMYVFRAGDQFPMPSMIAGTATWVNEHTLQLNVRMVEAIFGDSITCVFEGDKISVTFLNSVAEAATKKTPDGRKGLTGTMTT